MTPTHDVLIAGAGPVGLFLAGELRLAGLSVLVLERVTGPHSPLKQLPFGLRGLSQPTIEALRRRGLLDAVAAPGKSGGTGGGHWTHQSRRPGGHFAGIQFFGDRVDPSTWSYYLPGAVTPPLAVAMDHLEQVLSDRAHALGVEIRRGVAVDGVDQTEDCVTVRAGDALFQARWLVGCDGGRSAVRRAAGFAFVGTDPEFTGYSAVVELADPTMLQPGRHHVSAGMYTFAPPGTVTMVEFDRGAVHRTEPITREHVQDVLRRVSGIDVTVTALCQATTWTDRAYQAATYRRGRVLLAGDAAHIHSPLGGQGLNLGLGDAMNLGWKLAAAIRGTAPDGLLDSYERERHPVGAQILDWSRAQVALMRPDSGDRALTAIIRDLIETRDGATYFAARVWGVALRYDLGDDHPLVGRSAPELELTDGTTLSRHLTTGEGLLLDLDPVAPLRTEADRWRNRLRYVAGETRDRLGLRALLVRPDGVVAWTADDATPDVEGLEVALSRWFGPPLPVA